MIAHVSRFCTRRLASLVVAALAVLMVVPVRAAAAALRVDPPQVVLHGAFARQQLLVSSLESDVTRSVAYESSDSKIASVDAKGFIVPLANGNTRIVISHAGQTLSVPVAVTGMEVVPAVDFAMEIEPLLSRFGCNSGGCHGKASGQNGFKLSLFGFDAAFDYAAIAKDARGRRIFASSPDRSLLLQKATGQVPHGGGKRLDPGDEAYRTILAWIQSGAPPASESIPTVAKLEIAPARRRFRPGETQQLAVTVVYSDGARRDVTRDAEFSSNLDVVAAVSDDGYVTANELSGEATIMARYRGQVAVFQALRIRTNEPTPAETPFSATNYIDELNAVKWRQLGLTPSRSTDDATFLRRATVDLAGRLPTVDEARAYLDDASPNKSGILIDRLLESPDHAAYFALKWGSILRNSSLAGSEKASYAFHNWLKDMIARNRPYDEFVRGIVAASGEWQDAPAINWFWQSRDDQLHMVTADTAQVFLGLRLQCARCHHHPYERWGQDDYFGLAGFFTRLGRKSFGEPPPYFASANVTIGEIHPLTGKQIEPKYLNGPIAKFGPEDDPRHALVDWMAQPENPFFAKALVNRLWGHFFGRGLVNEVDDMRETNPPSNPELLNRLAGEFIESKFDVRRMIRLVANSRSYRLSADPAPGNVGDIQNFARFYARRLPAEVIHDAIDQTCGTKTQFNNMGSLARAVDLPNERFGSYMLDAFDRPKRVSGCECERSTSATLAQVLLLANSDEVEGKIHHGQGRVHKLMEAKTPLPAAVEELYLAAFSRRPADAERSQAVAYVERQTDPKIGLQDLLWSLLNSREFLFNH